MRICELTGVIAVLSSISIDLACAVKPVVDVGYTRYRGTELSNGITQWLGMRYAAPPLGNLRFRAPADPPVNSTTQNANKVCGCHTYPIATFKPSDLSAWESMPQYRRKVFSHREAGRLSFPRRFCAIKRNVGLQFASYVLHSGRRTQFAIELKL